MLSLRGESNSTGFYYICIGQFMLFFLSWINKLKENETIGQKERINCMKCFTQMGQMGGQKIDR